MAKDKSAKQPKKAKEPKVSPDAISVAAHPRAAYGIARAKGLGGLIGLLLVGLLSWRAGTPLVDTGVRALIGGGVGYVFCWALAVQAWRHLVVAEARAAAERARGRAAEPGA